MNRLKKFVLLFGLSIVSVLAVTSPVTVFAEPTAPSPSTTPPSSTKTTTTPKKLSKSSDPALCSQNFLTFPTWFRGLVKIDETSLGSGHYECMIKSPDEAGGLSNFIWHIVLNVIEMALQAVVYLTAGFILWGGFQFLTSQGSPEVNAKARQTILNAAIGMGISIGAIAAVNLISAILLNTT